VPVHTSSGPAQAGIQFSRLVSRFKAYSFSLTGNAYRHVSPGTVEEKIWKLQQSKAQTIADVLGEEGFARRLSKTDLEYLFAEV
jgi:hypothetical protein